MNEGWIMLHRQLLDSPIIKKPSYCHLWVVLLLKAAHKGTDFIWNNRKQTLLSGQLLDPGIIQVSFQPVFPEYLFPHVQALAAVKGPEMKAETETP